MAKLKAPLLSLGASGAIAKTIVYFPWKGLNVAREYIVPANPKTTKQTTQRGYLRTAVDFIHRLQALPAPDKLGSTDQMAYALLGSTFPTPRTWFNQIVKGYLDQMVNKGWPIIYCGGLLTPAANLITLRVRPSSEDGNMADATVNWGTSKTALINSQAVTHANLVAGVDITSMVTKTKYYLQVRPTAPATCIGARSGIYYAKTL